MRSLMWTSYTSKPAEQKAEVISLSPLEPYRIPHHNGLHTSSLKIATLQLEAEFIHFSEVKVGSQVTCQLGACLFFNPSLSYSINPAGTHSIPQWHRQDCTVSSRAGRKSPPKCLSWQSYPHRQQSHRCTRSNHDHPPQQHTRSFFSSVVLPKQTGARSNFLQISKNSSTFLSSTSMQRPIPNHPTQNHHTQFLIEEVLESRELALSLKIETANDMTSSKQLHTNHQRKPFRKEQQ